MRFLQFIPIYQERVWGGQALKSKLGRNLPSNEPFGESWEIVDRPEAQSTVVDGQYKGLTIRELLNLHSTKIMGPDWNASTPFPILVKWLDCQDRLSLQVHPPAKVASKLHGQPKTENWYIVDAEPGAALLVGLKRGVTKAQFEEALKNNALEPLVHRIPSQVGNSMFVPSGRIHAIDAGNLILEIQQNSDTTYRVYDWGRVGLDGKLRQLHIQESLESIDFDDFEPEGIAAADDNDELANSAVFCLRRHRLQAGETLNFKAKEQPRLIGVAKGTIQETHDNAKLMKGDNVLLPYQEDFSFLATQDSILIETCGFA